MVFQILDLDLFYTGGPSQWAYITQGDATFGGFKFNIIHNNEYYTIPSGTVFYLNGSRPDGHVFSYPCTWSGHTVVCAVEESMSDYPGTVPCVLNMFDVNGGVVGSSKIIVFVENNPIARAKVTSNDFKSIMAALEAAAKVSSVGMMLTYNSATETIEAKDIRR